MRAFSSARLISRHLPRLQLRAGVDSTTVPLRHFAVRPRLPQAGKWAKSKGDETQSSAEHYTQPELSQGFSFNTPATPNFTEPALTPELQKLLSEDVLIVRREIEMANIVMGFEQRNKYTILNLRGEVVGHIEESGSNIVVRQLLRKRRPFTAQVLSPHGEPLLEIHRPMYLLNSKTVVKDCSSGIDYGEVLQRFHLLRREYDVFTAKEGKLMQSSYVKEWPLSWSFHFRDENDRVCALVDKSYTMQNFLRDMFGEASVYAVNFANVIVDSDRGMSNVAGSTLTHSSGGGAATCHIVPFEGKTLTYAERAITLAAAVTVDFDYFTRSSSGGMLPFLAIMSST
mmetsp:Transcript_4159/g.8183  ORF Transcript_4159/g.8183 Transcript_4159/m.8183 type:complete len:342 (-) Transcript_4159:116-1141(-)